MTDSSPDQPDHPTDEPAAPAAPIRVALVDDQSLLRAGLRLILEGEPDLEVVGEAADGADGVALAQRLRPDVVLMDVRMPGMDGVEATRRLTGGAGATSGGPRVLMLTTFHLDEYVVEAIRAGASGFLLKDAPTDELVEAVRVVARGDAVVAPAVTRRLLDQFVRQLPATSATLAAPAGLGELTEREREVLLLIARGLSNAEIAAELFVTETTVKTHVRHLLGKLGLRDRVQAVVLAYEAGLVRPGDGA